jgi:hypothetical protein
MTNLLNIMNRLNFCFNFNVHHYIKATADKVKELKDFGVDVSTVPAAELSAGDGPVLMAEKQWMQQLKSLRTAGRVWYHPLPFGPFDQHVLFSLVISPDRAS